jgi:hypothetical protein
MSQAILKHICLNWTSMFFRYIFFLDPRSFCDGVQLFSCLLLKAAKRETGGFGNQGAQNWLHVNWSQTIHAPPHIMIVIDN